MKKYIQYLIAFALFIAPHAYASKYVIGHRPLAGLFYNYLGVINKIMWCKKNNKTPVVYWGPDSLYHEKHGHQGKKNVWEYYFEPVSHESYNLGDAIDGADQTPDGNIISPIQVALCDKYDENELRVKGHVIIKEYIHLRPYLTQKIDSFYRAHMADKKTIGIHLRGTDKKYEVIPVNIYEMLNDANALAQRFPNCQFLVATDEERLMKIAKSVLKGKVIHYDARRSKKGKALHHDRKIKHKAQLGEDVIIEATLLSRCDLFLHTCSSVSTAVLFMNPDLEHKKYKQFDATS